MYEVVRRYNSLPVLDLTGEVHWVYRRYSSSQSGYSCTAVVVRPSTLIIETTEDKHVIITSLTLWYHYQSQYKYQLHRYKYLVFKVPVRYRYKYRYRTCGFEVEFACMRGSARTQ